MDLELLRSVLAVVEHRSVTRAAAALDVSQPGLSRRLARLEVDLGTTLFDRTGKGLDLTPAGEEVATYAARTLQAYDDLLHRIAPDEVALRGPLTVLASSTPADRLVPELLAAFTAQHPHVEARLVEAGSMEIPRRILDEGWDVGFVGSAVDEPGLTTIPIANDEIVIAVPADHRFAGRRSVRADELAGERLITRNTTSGTATTVAVALQHAGTDLPPMREVLRVGSTRAVVRAVADGLGIGFVSRAAIETSSAGTVVGLALQHVDLTRTLLAVHPSGRALSAAASAFLAGLDDHPLAATGRTTV